MKNVVFILTIFLIGINTSAQELVDSILVLSEKIIYFDTDEYQLTPAHQDTISTLYSISSKYDSITWIVKAHTDKIGSLEYNQRLSEKRQNSVVQYLLQKGVSDSLISSHSYGESLPLSSSNDNLNRRAFIQIAIPKKYLFLRGQVVDLDTRTGISAKVKITTKTFGIEKETDSIGHFRILAPYHDTVNLSITSPGYFFEANELLISEKQRNRILTIPLPKIEIGKKYSLRNMLFLGDRSLLLTKQDWKIRNLVWFMESNEELCIQINGHINKPFYNKVKRESSNFELSVARALEIKNKLVQEGIESKRIKTKGNGNWEMKYPNAKSLEDQQANRRVEIGIIDCQSKSNEDHQLEDLPRYRLPILNRTYNERLFRSDLENYGKIQMTAVLVEVEKMKANGKDPSRYSYKQLVNLHAGIPLPEE